MSRKSAHGAERKPGFLFLGNHPVLDFLNTRPVLNGEAVELLPDFGALSCWFEAARLVTPRERALLGKRWGEAVRAQRVAKEMRALRERLRNAVFAWQRGGNVHRDLAGELNQLMAEHPMRAKFKADGSVSSVELYFEPRQHEDLFAPIANMGAMLFASLDRKRVRKCDHCVLLFHDVSKKGTRRWCSMQLCGNRKKVAAYAARRRKGTPRIRIGSLEGS